MNTPDLYQSKKIRIISGALLLSLTAALLAFKTLHKPTLTSYKDERFIIYECSQPIKAKKGTVPDLFGGRMEAYVPADQAEAQRYCKETGVE